MLFSLIKHSSLLFRRRLKSLLRQLWIVLPRYLSGFSITPDLGIGGYYCSRQPLWVYLSLQNLLNKVTKKDEEDGRLALIISLLIESWPVAFFAFKSVAPLTFSSLVKGESKTVFLIFLSVSLYRKRYWSSFLSFSEYRNFEKCSTSCCGETTFGVLDLIAHSPWF